jgi:oligopeptide transport system substrate-binding protein
MRIRTICMRWGSALFACLALAGCTPSGTPKVRESTKGLNLYLQADLLSTDPRIACDRRSFQVIRELFEGLVRIGENGKPELALASSYTVSEDGTVYTFHLRPVKWSNGMDVTADNFVYAWKNSLDNSFGATGAYILFIIKNARKANTNACSIDEVGVRAIDPSTLEVTLEHPAPYFLELLVLPIFSPVCQAAVEKNPNWAGGVSPEYVCNGPYILKDRELKSHVTLEKNPYYQGTKPAKTDRLHFAIVEDPQTAYNMFQDGVLDWCGDTCGNMSLETVYELHRKGALITKFSGGAQWLFCNVEQPHLASAKVRKAIAYAIDRRAICEKLLQGGETPAYSLALHSMSLLRDKPFEYNPALARRLFEEGMAELGYTKETFPPIVITLFSEPVIKAVVEAEQEQIQKTLGITVQLLPGDWATFMKKFRSGDYQMLSMVWFTFYQDPMYNFECVKHRKQGINSTGWENARYISLLDKADQSIDPLVRRNYLQQAEQLLMEELPVIPVFYHTFKYAKAPHLTGEAISGSGQMELRWLEKRVAG